MAIDSFIFGGNTGLTYEQLKRRRAVALALASQRRGFPKTVGEGMTYLGESIGDMIAERRLDAAERAQGITDRAALNPQMMPPAAGPAIPPAAPRPPTTPVRPPVSPGAGSPVAPVSPRPAPAATAAPAPSARQFGPPVGELTQGYVRLPGPSAEGMTSGPPPSEFAMGGILNAAPMAAPNLEPVFPGEEGIPSQTAGIVPSSGYLPPTATAAAPPSNLPAPTAAPTEPNAMDEAGWPTGPRRDLLSTETGAPISPELQRAQEFQRQQGRPVTGPTGAPQTAPGGQGTAPGYTAPRSEVESYIRQAAVERGIDPEIAIRVARSEGISNWRSTASRGSIREPSYGPYQLLVGGPGTGYPRGLGNEAPFDPTDPNTWRENVNFALDKAREQGWRPWYGAKKVGITGYAGIGEAPGGEGVTLAAYAPTGGVSDAPIPGMGGAGAPRLRPQIPPLQGPPSAPEETGITPTDIEPMPSTAQFGGRERFVRTDAPVPGIPAAPEPALRPRPGGPPMQAGAAVPPPIEPMDPGPEPRPPAKTSEMLHYQNVASDPKYSDQTRAEAARRHDEALKAQREDFTRQWSVWKAEKLKFDDPATRLQLRHSQLANEKAVRDLEGEGFRPLTPEEAASLPKPPEGQIVYANRRGELKFGPTPPASTTVNVDTKATGKGQEALQTKMAEQFVEMFTAGNTAADDLRTVTEMRELATRVKTGPEAVAKQFAGRWGIKTEGVSNIEALNAMINRIIPQQRVPGSGTSSDFDSRMFQASVPALMNTDAGNQLIMDTMEGASRNKMMRAEVAGKVISGQLTVQEGVKETLALQAQARALSDRVKDFLVKGGAGAETTGPTMSRENQRAIDWATQNPTDPRAQEIKKRLGVP